MWNSNVMILISRIKWTNYKIKCKSLKASLKRLFWRPVFWPEVPSCVFFVPPHWVALVGAAVCAEVVSSCRRRSSEEEDEEGEEEEEEGPQLSAWTHQTSGGNFTPPPTAAAPPPASCSPVSRCPALRASQPGKVQRNPRGLLRSLLAERGWQCGGGGTVCGRDITVHRHVRSIDTYYIRRGFSK